MAVQVQSPIRIIIRLQESPSKDLDVVAAFAKQPDIVREALLEATCLVQPRSADVALLQIQIEFESVLKQPWKEPRKIRQLLDACRQQKVTSRTEKVFFEYGDVYGVVGLCLVAQPNGHTLLRQIDALQDEDIIKLVNKVKKIPKRPAIADFIEEFNGIPYDFVSDPPPQLARPRTRKKVKIPPTEDSRSLSPEGTDLGTSEVTKNNKRRKLPGARVYATRDPPLNQIRLPSPHEMGLSALPHTPAEAANSSQLLFPSCPQYLSQIEPTERPDLAQVRPSLPNGKNLLEDRTSRTMLDNQTLQIPGLAGQAGQVGQVGWNIPGPKFIPNLPLELEVQEGWNIPGPEFIPNLPLEFEGQEGWNIPGPEFIPNLPLEFEGQEGWNIPGPEFIPNLPLEFEGQEGWNIPEDKFV